MPCVQNRFCPCVEPSQHVDAMPAWIRNLDSARKARWQFDYITKKNKNRLIEYILVYTKLNIYGLQLLIYDTYVCFDYWNAPHAREITMATVQHYGMKCETPDLWSLYRDQQHTLRSCAGMKLHTFWLGIKNSWLLATPGRQHSRVLRTTILDGSGECVYLSCLWR